VDRHRHQPVSAPATELIGRDTCAASLIEHACRQVLRLQVLRAKETITILRILLDAIKHCGKPKAIRTDNEAIFTPDRRAPVVNRDDRFWPGVFISRDHGECRHGDDSALRRDQFGI
jgi:hypothetical protein